MRAWDVFNGLENTVKNMLTSLRAVTELQNPAIRDRHWMQLMQATGVSEISCVTYQLLISSLSASYQLLSSLSAHYLLPISSLSAS